MQSSKINKTPAHLRETELGINNARALTREIKMLQRWEENEATFLYSSHSASQSARTSCQKMFYNSLDSSIFDFDYCGREESDFWFCSEAAFDGWQTRALHETMKFVVLWNAKTEPLRWDFASRAVVAARKGDEGKYSCPPKTQSATEMEIFCYQQSSRLKASLSPKDYFAFSLCDVWYVSLYMEMQIMHSTSRVVRRRVLSICAKTSANCEEELFCKYFMQSLTVKGKLMSLEVRVNQIKRVVEDEILDLIAI